jgi:TatD DNase family protein
MSLIDTHAHFDGYARGGALEEMLAEARAAGVDQAIAIGTGADDWEIGRELARSHPGVLHHAVGVHPCSVGENWEEVVGKLEAKWKGDPRPVGLGECGLDRFHLPSDPAGAESAFARQRAAFEAQLDLARRLGVAVVVHSRGAFQPCLEMIDQSGVDWRRVVFHCFTEGPEEIAQLNRRGGRGSFTGILTYNKAEGVRAAARKQGLEMLMLETDAPYLAPVPHRGQPNRPAYLRHTAEFASALFGISFDELAATTTANAREFFGI